jgi:hypothetical protein
LLTFYCFCIKKRSSANKALEHAHVSRSKMKEKGSKARFKVLRRQMGCRAQFCLDYAMTSSLPRSRGFEGSAVMRITQTFGK